MKRGDLLIAKRGVNTAPGTRYCQGIILETQPHSDTAKIAWYDGTVRLEKISIFIKYYERLSSEQG